VYLFLAGMMLLSEVARQEGLFDWLVTLAVRQTAIRIQDAAAAIQRRDASKQRRKHISRTPARRRSQSRWNHRYDKAFCLLDLSNDFLDDGRQQ
jgi:hypothetical protein